MNCNSVLNDLYKEALQLKDVSELDYLKVSSILINEENTRIFNELDVSNKNNQTLIAELNIYRNFISEQNLINEFNDFYYKNNQESLKKQAEGYLSFINQMIHLKQCGESLEYQQIKALSNARAFLEGYSNTN